MKAVDGKSRIGRDQFCPQWHWNHLPGCLWAVKLCFLAARKGQARVDRKRETFGR